MEILCIDLGKSVADIGAGSGWFTVRAARRVGEGGTVFAVDINPEAIQYVENRTKKENLHNVQVLLSKPDDPMLLERSRRRAPPQSPPSRNEGRRFPPRQPNLQRISTRS